MCTNTHARTHRPCIWLLNSESRQLNRGRFSFDLFFSVDTDTTKTCVQAQLWFESKYNLCVFYCNLFFPFFTSLFTLRYKIDQRSIILFFFCIDILQQSERQVIRLLQVELIQKEWKHFREASNLVIVISCVSLIF